MTTWAIRDDKAGFVGLIGDEAVSPDITMTIGNREYPVMLNRELPSGFVFLATKNEIAIMYKGAVNIFDMSRYINQ